jgi:hypothetical protein
VVKRLQNNKTVAAVCPVPLNGEARASLKRARRREEDALRVMEEHWYEVAALFYLVGEHFETHNGGDVMGKREHGQISAGLQSIMRGVERRFDAALVELFNVRNEMIESEQKMLAKIEEGTC